MSDEGLPASPPSPESDAAPAGCCGWFSSSSRRRRAAARKYVAPGDGPSKQAGLELSAAVAAEPAEAQPTTLGQTRETNKSVSSANGASSSSPAPTRVAFAEPAPAAHPGSSDSPPPARDESTDPSPAVAFLAQWECAVKLLREYCNAATESSPASSTLIASWIEEEGFSPLVRVLSAHAASIAMDEADGYPASAAFPRSPVASDPESGRLLLDAYAGATFAPTSPSTSVALRWSRRQTMRSQRGASQDLFFPAALPSAHRATLATHDRHTSLEHPPIDTLTRGISASAVGNDAEDDVPALPGIAPTHPQLSLDLTSAQMLNQQAQQSFTSRMALSHSQQQNHQQQQHVVLPPQPAALDPEVFRGVDQLARAVGEQIVLAHLADLETKPREARGTRASNAQTTTGEADAVTTAQDQAESLAAPVVASWIIALVAALRQALQACVDATDETPAPVSALVDVTASLFRTLLPAAARSPIIVIIPSLDSSTSVAHRQQALDHLALLLSLTTPLLRYYASDRSQLVRGLPMSTTQQVDEDASSGAFFPPREALLAACPPHIALALCSQSTGTSPSAHGSSDADIVAAACTIYRLADQLALSPEREAISHRTASIPLAATTADLRRLMRIVRWTSQMRRGGGSDSTATTTASLARAYAHALEALLGLFWAALAGGRARHGDEELVARLCAAWYDALASVASACEEMCDDASAAVELSASSNENEAEPDPTTSPDSSRLTDAISSVFLAVRGPLLVDPSVLDGVEVVPSFASLLASGAALVFDPLSQPVELHASASSATQRTLPRAQLALARAIGAVTRIATSRAFIQWQAKWVAEGGQNTSEPDAPLPTIAPTTISPLIELAWLWDSLLPLFTPTGGVIYQFLSDASSSAAEMDSYDDADEYDMLDEINGAATPRPPPDAHLVRLQVCVESCLCAFLSQRVFASPTGRHPHACPWLLDDTFTTAYLRLHQLALVTYLHAPPASPSPSNTDTAAATTSKANSSSEHLAIAHAEVLQAAASVPAVLMLRSAGAPSVPATVVRLRHIHFQLRHLGLVAWLTDEMSLEADTNEGDPPVDKRAPAEDGLVDRTSVQVEEMQPPPISHASTADVKPEAALPPEDVGSQANHDDGYDDVGSRSGGGSGSDDGSDFSEINFEDSYDEYDAPPPALPATIGAAGGMRLQIVQGARHINEQYALDFDGRPLYPAADEPMQQEVAPVEPQQPSTEQEPNQAEEQGGEKNASRSAAADQSMSDLGDDGWGDDSEDDEPPPQPRVGLAFSLPIAVPREEVSEGGVEAEQVPVVESAPVATVAAIEPAPAALSSPSPGEFALGSFTGVADGSVASYASRRASRLIYRSPDLHAALVDLLLVLCLDPSSHAGHALNPLYLSRFPLQPSEEQVRAGERMQRVNDAAESGASAKARGVGDHDASMSFDDLPEEDGETLAPLARNVLYDLRRHVNHAENAYLCAALLRRHDEAVASHTLSRDRARSLRRLMKLLFDGLFDPRAYTRRVQIGRGRFASVFSAVYEGGVGGRDTSLDAGSATAPMTRVALKQVDQPTSPHDQVLLVDLFTEISILECMRPATTGAGTNDRHAGGVLDVIDFGVGDGAFWIVVPLAQHSLKSFKVRQAVEEGSTEGAVVSRGLVRALLDGLYESKTASRLEGLLLGSTPQVRRLLASLALYAQALDACDALEQHQIVHFDIKADNFLIFAQTTTPKDDPSATTTKPPPLQVALADFGEAMFVSSAGVSSSSSVVGGMFSDSSLGGGVGSRISRGTENIQSPEMSTLIRDLDRTDERHDRRRKHEADFASDVWSIGALFYEVCMHAYGEVECGAAGLLFEEAPGLPLFLQITSPTLPLLSPTKAAVLARPSHLGPALLAPCVAFLAFVLRRDRLQRPSLGQVVHRFRDTVAELIAVALAEAGQTAIAQEGRIQARAGQEQAKIGGGRVTPKSASRPRLEQPPLLPSATTRDLCLCTPPPTRWMGRIPAPFRCSRCISREPSARLDTALVRYASSGVSAFRRRATTSLLAPTSVTACTADGQTLRLYACTASDGADTLRALLATCDEIIQDDGNPSSSGILLAYDARTEVSIAAQHALTRLAQSTAMIFFLPVRALATSESSLADEIVLPTSSGLSYALTASLLNDALAFLRSHASTRLLAVAPDGDVSTASSLLLALVRVHLSRLAPRTPLAPIEDDALLRAAATQIGARA